MLVRATDYCSLFRTGHQTDRFVPAPQTSAEKTLSGAMCPCVNASRPEGNPKGKPKGTGGAAAAAAIRGPVHRTGPPPRRSRTASATRAHHRAFSYEAVTTPRPPCRRVIAPVAVRPPQRRTTLHVLAPSRAQSPHRTGNSHRAGGGSRPARLRRPRHRPVPRPRRGHPHSRRFVRESGDLAGLRGHRHHPRRQHVLLLGLHHALLAGGTHPPLVRPGQLGVRRTFGARPGLRPQVRPERRPRLRQGNLGVVPRLPAEQPHVLLAGLHRIRYVVPLHRSGRRRAVAQAHRDQQRLLRRGPARRQRRHPVRGLREHHHQRGPALRRRAQPGPCAAGVHHAVERRDAGGLPLLQDQRELLHLPHPPGETASTS